MVRVSDGESYNQPPAFTTIEVNVMNEAPRVLLDGQVGVLLIYCHIPDSYICSQSLSVEAVMVDGSPALNLTSSTAAILEDSLLLFQLTITLTNPQEPLFSESISLPSSHSLPEEMSLSASADGRVLQLSGAASPDAYTSALSAVVYRNAKMASIIENQPNFTPRQVDQKNYFVNSPIYVQM